MCAAIVMSCGAWHAYLDVETVPNHPGAPLTCPCCTHPLCAPAFSVVSAQGLADDSVVAAVS